MRKPSMWSPDREEVARLLRRNDRCLRISS
jgi:hypothetical protein